MRALSLVGLAGSLALVVGTVAAVAAAASPLPAMTEIMGSTGVRVQPTELALDPDTPIDGITWSSWTGANASGTGTLHVDEGNFSQPDATATLSLSNPRACGPYRLFTTGTWSTSTGQNGTLPVGCEVYQVETQNTTVEAARIGQHDRKYTIGDPVAYGMRWTAWNRPVVNGHGHLLDGDGYDTYGYRVRLSHVRFCAARGLLLYTHMTTTLTYKQHIRPHRERFNFEQDCAPSDAQ